MPEPEELDKNSKGTRSVAALIVSVEWENWVELQRCIEAAGGRIIYRSIRPPWVHLRVVEEESP